MLRLFGLFCNLKVIWNEHIVFTHEHLVKFTSLFKKQPNNLYGTPDVSNAFLWRELHKGFRFFIKKKNQAALNLHDLSVSATPCDFSDS